MVVEIRNLGTEQRNERSANLDQLSTREIIQIMNEEDLNVVAGVKEGLPQIEKCVEAMIKTLNNKGHIFYMGAGTSGRTGIIDAVECGPTFSCTDEFQAIMAGGNGAVFKAVEGCEDDDVQAVVDLKERGFTKDDMLIGVAASGRTPYVIGALKYARELGAVTGCVCCNKNTEIGKLVDYPIEVSAGPEVLTGSTRLKSGTCQKVIINMLSTASMIGVGKIYKNLMVDVMATNQKLYTRCRHIVMDATGCDYDTADKALIETKNHCKPAIVMILLNCSKDEAEKALVESNGWVRKAVEK